MVLFTSNLPREDCTAFFHELIPRCTRFPRTWWAMPTPAEFTLRRLWLPPRVLAYLLECAARARSRKQTRRVLPCSATYQPGNLDRSLVLLPHLGPLTSWSLLSHLKQECWTD